MNIGQRAHLYSVYFAPRGRERLLNLGTQLAQIHLDFSDKLIGIVGDAGSGKSSIIKGMFPGVELSNNDDGLDARKIMQVRNTLDNQYDSSTYHLDMRFQMAFTQMFEVVDFVRGALKKGRRVIVEHFDLLYPYLGVNASLIIGVGEEIIVTRPTIFGPMPQDIYDIVFNSLKRRKMAHTAEDLTTLVLKKIYRIPFNVLNSDVRGGFVLNFTEKPNIDIGELEKKVSELIGQNLSVSYNDENSIRIGDLEVIPCTGPRIHIKNTSEIENFSLVKEIFYDDKIKMYALVGLVGDEKREMADLNKIRREQF
ncbi:alanine-tRNA synthetase second additional domain-containing protein [Anaeropeptidivorans aminofermentans]|uniref:alanine-tRNA synthetase second additional domain-containing protein n=1 Tax=Anaeropeptidivorans aminofermentans TaxID=2934315 RepID=UPI002025B3EF|nr:alanine-tRNA synthetase second additional domain-containing protein [Anaeropeptidivorans aminofermentans]MBE6011741.1 alanine-tRNA synthetase second additional domain-containing protein [Lachnospiraceae bacterium]